MSARACVLISCCTVNTSISLLSNSLTRRSRAVVSATCRLVVISTFADGPADQAGIESGDVFVAVDADSIDGWSVDEVTATVRGDAGTDVTITIQRGEIQLDITITRAALVIPVVERSGGRLGYLK